MQVEERVALDQIVSVRLVVSRGQSLSADQSTALRQSNTVTMTLLYRRCRT